MRTFRTFGACFLTRRGFLAIVLALAVLTSAGWWWRSNPAPLLWSDIREGDGAVLSLAAGKDPSGNEIVVAGGYFRTDASGRDLRLLCYDSTNGRGRWEAREDKALPNMMTDPIIAIDPAGDVLVGWEAAAARLGANKAVSKFAGTDGRPLWNWNLENAYVGTSMTAIPVPGPTGALWVSGIRKVSGEHRRFVAALDPKTGALLWQDDLNAARDGFDRPAEIHHLKAGGATVVIPPRGGEGKFPWIIQHRSSADGRVRWQHEIIRDNDRSLQGLGWLIDEGNGQVVVSWNLVTAGRMHFHIAAHELTTGAERWHVRDTIPADDFRSGVEAVTLGMGGGIELWGRHVREIVHTKWWSWRVEEGIPYPEQDREIIEQPVRVTLSPTDGTFRKRELLGRPNERVMARLARPGVAAEAMILCHLDHRELNHSDQPRRFPWRADAITYGSWAGVLQRPPAGALATLDFPNHATLTPSGRLVIAGDPAEDKRRWQIRVW